MRQHIIKGGLVMNNTIIEFLNLKEDCIESISCESLKDELIVFLSLSVRPHPCISCGVPTSKILSKYTRKINHGLFIDRKCTVIYSQKRYYCPVCNTSFNEDNSLVSKGQKKSLASHLQMMNLLKDPHMTFSKVGELLHLSPNTIIDTFYDNLPKHTVHFPEALCIDEIYLGRNSIKKYVAVLLDFKNNTIVDIIYGRTKDALHSYFQRVPKEQLNKVKYISSDMYEGYRFLQRHYFKNAVVCVDSFHVIQLILSMYNKQLLSVLRNHLKGSDEYYLLKHKRFILLKNNSSIDWFKQEYNRKLNRYVYNETYKQLLFQIDPMISEIYNLKEEYIGFNRLRTKELAIERIDTLITKFKTNENQEIQRVGRSLLKWKKEIINSFTWIDGNRISNGRIESRNNTIKLIIRNAAGYRNFEHLRSRIIYCINSNKKE